MTKKQKIMVRFVLLLLGTGVFLYLKGYRLSPASIINDYEGVNPGAKVVDVVSTPLQGDLYIVSVGEDFAIIPIRKNLFLYKTNDKKIQTPQKWELVEEGVERLYYLSKTDWNQLALYRLEHDFQLYREFLVHDEDRSGMRVEREIINPLRDDYYDDLLGFQRIALMRDDSLLSIDHGAMLGYNYGELPIEEPFKLRVDGQEYNIDDPTILPKIEAIERGGIFSEALENYSDDFELVFEMEIEYDNGYQHYKDIFTYYRYRDHYVVGSIQIPLRDTNRYEPTMSYAHYNAWTIENMVREIEAQTGIKIAL